MANNHTVTGENEPRWIESAVRSDAQIPEAPNSAVRKVNSAPEPHRADAGPDDGLDAPALTEYQQKIVRNLLRWIRQELGGSLTTGQATILREIRAFYSVFLAFSGDIRTAAARAELARADKHLRALFRALGLDFSATPAQRKAKIERNRLEREEQALKTAIPAPQAASGETDAADRLSTAESEELDALADAVPEGRLAALESLSDRELLDLLRKERASG